VEPKGILINGEVVKHKENNPIKWGR